MAAFPRPIFPKLFLLLSAVSCLLPAQTTVTLSTSPNPSIFGAPVLMTATVTPATATGKVTFYDGVTVLGTKSLVSGVASLSTSIHPAHEAVPDPASSYGQDRRQPGKRSRRDVHHTP